jgi:hypothetical protein
VKTIKVPRYSYDYCYPKMEASGTMNVAQTTIDANAKTTAQLCGKYNNLSSRLVDTKEDLDAIRVITENIESGKKYPLSVGQLTSLGF